MVPSRPARAEQIMVGLAGAGSAATVAWHGVPESEAYLRSAFEDAPIGITLVGLGSDSDGRFLRVNPALCELTA